MTSTIDLHLYKVIGYIITGTIVYAVVVSMPACLFSLVKFTHDFRQISLSEMVSYIPNVGGPIGLADLYVDRALVSAQFVLLSYYLNWI